MTTSQQDHLTVAGGSPFAVRGIVEGFYGTPWTHEQRLDVIEFIAARGMNTFVYSPKDDPLVREHWRADYTGDQLAALGQLAAQCAKHGVEFVYCISPGLSIEYSNSRDLAALCSKLESLGPLGVRSFGLLLDDIPGELQHPADIAAFTDLADAHSQIISHVFDELLRHDARRKLIVCPTVYRGYGDEDYIVRLGRNVDPRVDLFWTGRAICSATIDLADAATITRSIARPVTYWDNYPVNDVAMGNELHIGPYRGRDRHLYRFCTGIIANGMELFESSKIAFATIADYLRAPEAYDPEASWQVAIRDVLGNDEDAAAFAVFADNVRSSCLSDEDAPVVSAAIERFAFRCTIGQDAEAAAELRLLADRLAEVAAYLSRGPVVNQQLIAEARPWLEAFEIGAAALARIADAAARGPLDDLDDRIRAELADDLRRLRATGRRVYGDSLEMTLSNYSSAA
jgi:hyaluronoglucosaminidase